MANYSIVVDSKFKPYSFQELLTPALMSTQAQRELEDSYADIMDKASIWEGMLNKDIDRKSYQQQQKYLKDLQAQRDALYKEGINPSNRRALLNLRARYNTEIVPIEQAYAARAKEAESQYAGRANGIVYEGDAATSSLDRYLKNPQIKYNMANSQEGFKRLATSASALQKELREYKKGKPLDRYVNTWLQKHGYKSTDVDSVINDVKKILQGDTNVETNGVLKHLLMDEMNVSGVSKWTNEAAKMDYFSRVAPALYQTVGPTQVATFENYGAKLATQKAMQKELARNSNNDNSLGKTYRVNPMALRAQQELSEKNKELQRQIKNGYLKITKRGLELTDKGWKELRTTTKNFNPERPAGMLQSVKRAEGKEYGAFKDWYINNIGGYEVKNNRIRVETPVTRLNKYTNSIKAGSYDTYHSTEYDRQVSGTYGDDWFKQLWPGAAIVKGEKVLKGVKFSGRKGWEETKNYTRKELEGYTVTNIRYSSYGNTAILQSTKEGKNDIIRVLIPSINIHPSASDNVRKAIANADYYGAILDKGYRPQLNSKGGIAVDANGNIKYTNVPLSYEDRIVFDNKREKTLQEIYGYGSQIVVPSETEDEKINPWY